MNHNSISTEEEHRPVAEKEQRIVTGYAKDSLTTAHHEKKIINSTGSQGNGGSSNSGATGSSNQSGSANNK